MGVLIKEIDTLGNNSMNLFENIFNSPFNKMLEDNPILVTYYHICDVSSTADNGFGTVDNYVGTESGLRFNKILDFPVYGLKELIPELTETEGEILTTNLEATITILPNTIKPNPMDLFVFKLTGNRKVTMTIDEIKLGTLKSNDYYQGTASIKSFVEDYEDKLDRQVVETFRANLETIGTDPKCIMHNTLYEEIANLENITNNLLVQYLDVYFNERYNCICIEDFNNATGDEKIYNLYDQFLNGFIINQSILKSSNRSKLMTNYDNTSQYRKNYRKSIFRYIEDRDPKGVKHYIWSPIKIPNSHNPFDYYGEDVYFMTKLDELDITSLPQDGTLPNNYYLSFRLVHAILFNDETMVSNIVDKTIVRFMNADDITGILNEDEIQLLEQIDIESSKYYVYTIPMMIMTLRRLIQALKTR